MRFCNGTEAVPRKCLLHAHICDGGHCPPFFGDALFAVLSGKTVNVMLHRPAVVVNFGRVVTLL